MERSLQSVFHPGLPRLQNFSIYQLPEAFLTRWQRTMEAVLRSHEQTVPDPKMGNKFSRLAWKQRFWRTASISSPFQSRNGEVCQMISPKQNTNG